MLFRELVDRCDFEFIFSFTPYQNNSLDKAIKAVKINYILAPMSNHKWGRDETTVYWIIINIILGILLNSQLLLKEHVVAVVGLGVSLQRFILCPIPRPGGLAPFPWITATSSTWGCRWRSPRMYNWSRMWWHVQCWVHTLDPWCVSWTNSQFPSTCNSSCWLLSLKSYMAQEQVGMVSFKGA